MTVDWHAYQLTGSACGPRNCAAGAAADAIAAATGGRIQLTADQVRTESGVSCVKGEHSASGGLYISDVIRVCSQNGVTIDYGQLDSSPGTYSRWSIAILEQRLGGAFGAEILGDYDALPVVWRAPGSTFLGDHSAYVHDLRSDRTVCWHDPLRRSPIRIPIDAVLAYWGKPDSPVRRLAGFVKLPAIAPWWPARLGAPPAEAVAAIVVPAGTYWQLTATGARKHQFTTGGFSAYVAPIVTVGGRQITRLISGAFQGAWLPLSVARRIYRKPPA